MGNVVGKDIPPFLKDNPAATSSGKTPDVAPNIPQKSGATGDAGKALDEKDFPNLPQKSGEPKGNPQSVPSGGKLPYTSAPANPGKPYKLKG